MTSERRVVKDPSFAKKKRNKKSISEEMLAVARERFGFERLRAGQEEIIAALLGGSDCLAVMPTGSGKSAIYQIAGSMMPGVTLVVSPLIALQKDQVDSINEQAAHEAVLVNSTLGAAKAREVLDRVEEGDSKFIFLAPEQLHKRETIEKLERAEVSLFVIDEAHCISEWGHDFRPDYLDLGCVIERLNQPVVLAMTATASSQVREEIAGRLKLRDPRIFVRGFDRPNIYLRVDHFKTKEEKFEKLLSRVNWADKPGIVYVATRKTAEEIMSELAEAGVKALFYHGGLKASERHEMQEQFMNGEAEVMVATNAFGMGIDKADVRFVYHFDVSSSLDSYYQEIGRAGRDGEKAEAVLFFRREDMGVQKFHCGEGKIEVKDIQRVANAIAEQEGPVELESISTQADLSERKLSSVVHRLEDVGAVEILPSGEVELSQDVNAFEAVHAAVAVQEQRKEMKQERLCHMQEYADLSTCRREHLLRYFGDDFTGPCHNCDNCACESSSHRVDPSIGTRRVVA